MSNGLAQTIAIATPVKKDSFIGTVDFLVGRRWNGYGVEGFRRAMDIENSGRRS